MFLRYRGYCVSDWRGARLRREARDVRVADVRSPGVVDTAARRKKPQSPSSREGDRDRRQILKEILRAEVLIDVGRTTCARPPLATLSGQSQPQPGDLTRRPRRHSPCPDDRPIGLHSRDNLRLINILRQLRDHGNTVLVVEHDEDMIRVGDTIIDLGLGAGEQGGRVVFAGPLPNLLQDLRSLTAKYLRGDLAIPIPSSRRRGSGKEDPLRRAEHHLKNIDSTSPSTPHCITCVTDRKVELVHDVCIRP